MTCGFIYKIQFPNEKHYIGLTTTSLKQRQTQHKQFAKNGDKKCLYRAIRKYEIVDTFELIEIDKADTIEELREKEIRYIAQYNSYYMNGNGYNMTYGGEGTNGYIFTEDDNLKNSERTKKRYEERPEIRQQISEGLIKFNQEHPEARQQIQEKRKKTLEKNPEIMLQMIETRKKTLEENPEIMLQQTEKRKKTLEENPEIMLQMIETRKKTLEENPEIMLQQSKTRKALFKKPEFMQKHIEGQKKRFEKPEERERYSKNSKKQFEDPKQRQKQSEIKKQFYIDNPEAIEKNREAQKNRSPEWIKKKCDTMGKNNPFDVFTKDGTFLKTFTYQFDAKEYLQKEHHITSTIEIGSVLSGKRKSSGGFLFKYK
jgi:hypothetical protein